MSSAGQVAAFFDVDGTIARTDIVRYYLHFRTRGMSPAGRVLWLIGYLPQAMRWLALDQFDRQRMNVTFYRTYAGLRLDDLQSVLRTDYHQMLGRHVFAAARARIRAHRERGERVVLVTGSLDFIIDPLLADVGADDRIAVSMTTQNGRLTGELSGPPLGGDEKARVVEAYAREHQIDLARSWAYGDSMSDLPILSTVGHPVVVNPNRTLRAEASRRGWTSEIWV